MSVTPTVAAQRDEPSRGCEDPIVYYPSQEQLAEALQRELDKVGLTRAQLEEQAKAGRFDSELARQTWFCLP